MGQGDGPMTTEASGGVECKGCGVIVISVPAHEDGLCSVCIRERVEVWRKLALQAYEAWEEQYDLYAVLRPTMRAIREQLVMDVKESAPRDHGGKTG